MTRMHAVLATLVVYKLILVGLGLLAKQRTRDGLDFYLGGRGLGPVVASISASASSSSAWTLLGVSGAAYSWGLSAVWLFPSCVGGFLLNWFVLARPLRAHSRRTGTITVTEVLAGPASRPLSGAITWVSSIIVLFSLAFYVASQFEAAGKTFAKTFELGMTESVLVGAGVVVLYTMLGGFWAVSLTDTLQGLMMASTAIVLPIIALAAVGGPAALADGLHAASPEGYLSLTRHMAPAAGLGWIVGLFGIGIGYPGQPHVVNRFMALQDGEAPLRRARRIAICWAVVVYAGMILLGLCGRVLMPELADPEAVFIAVTNAYLPPAVAGAMIAAVLSAIMSTADSQLLVAGSAVTIDLKLGGSSAKTMLRRSRSVVLLLSLGAVAMALFAPQAIFHRVLFAFSAMGAAFGPLLLVTVLRAPPPPARALASIVVGFTLSVAAYNLASGSARGLLERVLPFVIALAIAWPGRGARRPDRV